MIDGGFSRFYPLLPYPASPSSFGCGCRPETSMPSATSLRVTRAASRVLFCTCSHLEQEQPVDFPGMARPAPLAQTPVKLSQTPGSIRHRAPLLGEHTDKIMREIGYGDGDIARLREERVI